MPEPRRVLPPRSEARPLTRGRRLAAPAALTDNDGTEALPAAGSHRRLAITRVEADA